MILKLIASVLIFVIALVERFYNKEVSKRKKVKRIFLTLLILSLLFSVVIIIIDDVENKNKHDYVVQRNDKLKTQIDSLIRITQTSENNATDRDIILQSKINELNDKLEPFVKLAIKKYPNMKIEDALSKLQLDLIETKKLATRDIYKSLSSNLKESLITSLSDYVKNQKSIPVIKFYVQQGNQNRYQVVNDLIEILNKAGIKATIGAMGLFPQSGPQYGVEIHTNSQYVAFINKLLEIVKDGYNLNSGIAVRDSEEWKNEGKFPDGEIQLIVSGTPLFSEDGKVTF